MLAALHTQIRRFAASRTGVAAVEFALIIPLLLLTYMGSVALTEAISVDRRVDTVAGAVGDLVARINPSAETLTTAKLNDYFSLAEAIIAPFDETDLEQVVTLVSVSAAGVTRVLWSRGYRGGTPHPVNATYDLPTQLNTIARGKWVVVAEAHYPYEPMFDNFPGFGVILPDTIGMYAEFFYLTRYGVSIPAPT